MDRYIFNLKLASKQMGKNAQRCSKQETLERAKCSKALRRGCVEAARIHAENCVRQRHQALTFLRLSSRLDAMATRLQGAKMARGLTRAMEGVTRAMDAALASMDLQRVVAVMERFDAQCDDLDVATAAGLDVDNVASSVVPQAQVEGLLAELADEAGIDVRVQLPQAAVDSVGAASLLVSDREELASRLKQLRRDN